MANHPPIPETGVTAPGDWADMLNACIGDLQNDSDLKDDRLLLVEAALGVGDGGEAVGGKRMPIYQPGKWYGPEPWRSAAGEDSFALEQDQLAFVPWWVPAHSGLDRLTLHVVSGGASGREVTLGQYTEVAGGDFALAHDYGALSCNVSNDSDVTLTVSPVVEPVPGFSWLAVLNTGNGTIALQARSTDDTWNYYGADNPFDAVEDAPASRVYDTGSEIAALPDLLPDFSDGDWAESDDPAVTFTVRGASIV